MERTPVKSTTMVSVGYDPISQLLEIEFVGGAVYQYMDVPEDIFLGLMQAESKGQYFNFVIRPAGFRYQQL